MNPQNLFTLTARQKNDYLKQPDMVTGNGREKIREEYEIPSFYPHFSLRFWYNTQTSSYSTHWHNAQEIIIPLEGDYIAAVQGDSYHLNPGDILLIPPGSLHSMAAPGNGSRFIFLLDLDIFCQLTDFIHTQSLLSKAVLLSAGSCPEIYECRTAN